MKLFFFGLNFSFFSYILIGETMKWVFLGLFSFFLFPILSFAYSAESMVAIDHASGRILYEQNATEEKLIASTTKIMTAIVAIEQMDINTNITVDERVLKAYGSGIYIEVGEVMSLKDLLYGLMLRSGNDAAIVIACGVSENMEAFVNLMNQKAYEIGMGHTQFYNSHGLEENDGTGNTSTAYDMAILMRYAMQNEVFREIVKTMNYEAKSNRKTYHWTNKNKLLSLYEYTIGGKTGFTKKAKRTLVTTAFKDGKEISIVTLNDGNDFLDHKNLYEVLFSRYSLITILKKDELQIEDFHYYDQDQLYLLKDATMLVTKDEVKDVHVSFDMQELADYQDQDQVGVVHIYLKDHEMYSLPVYVKKLEVKQKKGFLQSFFRWLFGW